MIVRFIKVGIAIVVVALVSFAQQQAMAGEWIFKPSLDGGPHLWEYHDSDSDYSHLSNTSPARPHPRNVRYSVTLYNPTRWTIAYSLNDRKEPRLKAGESVRWTIMGSKENPAVFNIAFDNGQKKLVRYRLENNSAFTFRNQGKSINLYKRK